MRRIRVHILTVNLYRTLLFFFFPIFVAPTKHSSLLKGSHLSVEKNGTDILYSEDYSFSCGFYQVATNAFIFAIWFTNSTDKTIAWRANIDHPVNGHGSRITLRKDGSLVLMDVGGAVVWSTNTTNTGAQTAELLNSGNLVVKDSNGKVQWQSFSSPTDTLLPLQPMTRDTTLVSASSAGSLSPGYYKFYFDTDYYLKLSYAGPDYPSIFWPPKIFETNENLSKVGFLDEKGYFSASDQLEFTASDFGAKIKRRLTLDYDGNLRIYSLDESTGNWSVSWVALPRPCEVRGICGPSGVCSYTQNKGGCSCPPGFAMIDPSDWSHGCSRTPHILSSYKNRSHAEFQFFELKHIDFSGFEIKDYVISSSFEECKNFCINHSSCEAFSYKPSGTTQCYPKFALISGRYSQNYHTYLKFPGTANLSSFNAFLQATEPVCKTAAKEYMTGVKVKWAYFYWFLSIFFVLEAVFIFIGWWFIFKNDPKSVSNEEGFKALWSQFRSFTYSELKTATRNFTDMVGRGGSGTVYKGVLTDGKVVAVKKLEDVIQGEEEFQAELSLIGRINHKNLVRMIGYCSELSKRVLVSEFVDNGSLDKVLFDDDHTSNIVLKWKNRYQIALGVAQGLAYLHHECLEWIIHCDVKPENILLDSDFDPKLADFGLAKLLKRGGIGSNLSRIRGTRGYIAPEWASSLPITGKVDVYSYGVVLMELVKGSRVSNWVMEGEDNVEMVLRRSLLVLKEKLQSKEMEWIESFVDLRLNGQFDQVQAVLLLKIAVSCLEDERSKRPTMDSVIKMMLSFDDENNI